MESIIPNFSSAASPAKNITISFIIPIQKCRVSLFSFFSFLIDCKYSSPFGSNCTHSFPLYFPFGTIPKDFTYPDFLSLLIVFLFVQFTTTKSFFNLRKTWISYHFITHHQWQKPHFSRFGVPTPGRFFIFSIRGFYPV